MDLGTTLALVALGMAMEAFFSGSEIALISASRIKIQQKSEEGHPAALALAQLLKTPERLFSITSLGTNLAVVVSSSVFAGYLVQHVGRMADLLTTLILGPLILFGGEIVPKLVFQSRADSIILHIVRPLILFDKLFSPVIFLFTRISAFLMKNQKDAETIKAMTFSREMIRRIISLETQTADLGKEEREMIHKIFDFGETTVAECMAPLVQIYAIRDTSTLSEAHQLAISSGYSRLPVYHQRMFNLIGVINTFDLLDQPCDDTPIEFLVRPAYYVPPNMKIGELLNGLQQRGLHMAIVVDEYGACIGIATIEDILEEIVGEIQDEYDKPETFYEKLNDGGYLINAEVRINTLNEEIKINLPEGDYETLGGLIISQLERIPATGDQVTVGNYRLTVRETGKRKIDTVILRQIALPPGTPHAPPAKPGYIQSKPHPSPPPIAAKPPATRKVL